MRMTSHRQPNPVRRGLAVAISLLALIGPSLFVTPTASPAAAADPEPGFLAEGAPAPHTDGFAGAGAPPTGFTDSQVLDGLDQPTSVAFSPDGRVFVTEKRGRLVVFDSLTDTTKSVVLDIHDEVNDFWDRGLAGIALAPTFPTDPSIWLLYTYDALPGGTHPQWDEDCPDPPGLTDDGCVVTGRLIKITVNAANGVTSRTTLISGEWCQQFPSHSQDDLAFGPDGYLYVSAGDGADFNDVDYGQNGGSPGSPIPINPCGDPADKGGAMRSQSPRRAAGEGVSLDGAVLRLVPSTGAGAPNNPYAASADLNARRIAAYGLRNPFRIAFRPGTSELWVGDVGWNMTEEINRFTPSSATAPNFGWPCFEGATSLTGYQSHAGCQLNLAETVQPHYSYPHVGGSSISGLAFYNGGAYPDMYDGALFFADYVQGEIRVMRPGAGGVPDPAQVSSFQETAPVDLTIGPGGDLFYVDFDGGTIHRIRYGAPSAVATASPTSGAAPLDVHFDGTGSSSPLGLGLSYAWDLDGDGQYDDGTTAEVDRTYTDPGQVQVRLRVTDAASSSTISAPIVISPANAPPTATIGSVQVGSTTYAPPPAFMTATPPANGVGPLAARVWIVGDTIHASGSASDPQDGSLPGTALSWTLTMHHCPSNCHAHQVQSFSGASVSFSAPDHEWPAYLSLRLTATDTGNLTASRTVYLYPKASTLTLTSTPPGAGVLVDGVAATRTNLVGHVATISAPTTFQSGGWQYRFSRWSDGNTAAARPLTITAANQSRVAQYTVVPKVVRAYGGDRYVTSAAVSAAAFAPGVPVAYVATGRDFPDALAAAAAAGKRGGPVLLVPGTSLPPSIRYELDRLNPTQIAVVGGPTVVTSAVMAQLEPYAGAAGVIRLSGSDRYATAVRISQNAFSPGAAGVPVAYVASGRNFPDALAAAAAAGAQDGPVLLVPGTSVPASVRVELDRLNPARIVVVGGPAIVSAEVESQLGPLAGSGGVDRLYGIDRYATAVAISKDAFGSAPQAYVATGRAFPDALAGAAAAGRAGGPVLLVPGTSLPPAVAAELDRLNPLRVTILGGPTVVTPSVEAQVKSAVGA